MLFRVTVTLFMDESMSTESVRYNQFKDLRQRFGFKTETLNCGISPTI